MGIEKVVINQEEVYLKKDKFGWRVIHPIKINGKVNWRNLLVGGSYWNLLKVGFLIIAISFLIWSYSHDIEAVRNSCQPFMTILP